MKKLGNRTEQALTIGLILLLAAVAVTQLFLLRPDTRAIFTDDAPQKEGGGLCEANRQAVITLETEQPEPGVFVVVNGVKKQSFIQKKVTIQVPEHSLIQISAEGVNHGISVAVTGLSDYVVRRNLNLKAEGEKNIFFIGRILFQ